LGTTYYSWAFEIKNNEDEFQKILKLSKKEWEQAYSLIQHRIHREEVKLLLEKIYTRSDK
jgi:hypothetical protein